MPNTFYPCQSDVTCVHLIGQLFLHPLVYWSIDLIHAPPVHRSVLVSVTKCSSLSKDRRLQFHTNCLLLLPIGYAESTFKSCVKNELEFNSNDVGHDVQSQWWSLCSWTHCSNDRGKDPFFLSLQTGWSQCVLLSRDSGDVGTRHRRADLQPTLRWPPSVAPSLNTQRVAVMHSASAI